MTRSLTLFRGVPPKLPPWQLINHQINLIDPDKWINYRLPKCLDALKEELAEKISQYTSAGWWVPATVRQAVLMLCVLKKNGKLRMVFNLRMQNENMEKDVSPFPDQDTIWHDITCAAYKSKLDMSEAYEQIRIGVVRECGGSPGQTCNHKHKQLCCIADYEDILLQRMQ